MEKIENLLERLRAHKDDEAEPSADVLARREVAAELRTLCHAIGRSPASSQQLRDVAAQLRAHGEVLRAANAVSRPATTKAPAAIPGMEDFRDRSPIAGLANPMAPPAVLAPDLESEIVRGEVTFGLAYEGAPGCVHGGFVAAVLDEALGMACVFSGGAAMTAELTTRYRRHTPVSTRLRIEARLESVDGRKIRTAGEVYHGDVVVAEGSGLFIAVDAAKFERLLAARSERSADG